MVELPTYQPVTRRQPKPSRWPIAVAVLIATGAGLSAGWFLRGNADTKTGVPIVQARKLPASAKPVVQWLAENLDDPDWQLVKFWPPRDMKEVRAERIAELQEFVSEQEKILRENPSIFDQFRQKELQEGRDLLAQTKDGPPDRVVRLRYRARVAGELKLRDEFFIVGQDGRAERALMPHLYKRFFPDAEK